MPAVKLTVDNPSLRLLQVILGPAKLTTEITHHMMAPLTAHVWTAQRD